MTSFIDLGLAEPLIHALEAEGYTAPTPIQAGAIPPLMNGKDVLGIAQTGTGKTAAFALPLLHRLHTNAARPRPRSCRVLVLTPTRELAVQVSESFTSYGRSMRFNRAVIFGGVSQGPQVKTMARGVDVLVATPGRLLDLINQGHVVLDQVEGFVLDEADRMLAMGFIQDVRKIVSRLPKERQTVMFSATMPPAIAALSSTILHMPERVEVTPESTTAERIRQTVLFVGRNDKRLLLEHLFAANGITRALVFTRTKHGANRLAESLDRAGFSASAIHGNKSQAARQHALNSFRDGQLRALVATDIAARGIDVEGLTHVINYELPNEPESYVHRIGRTARAGSEGAAISLCEMEEVAYLRDIEKSIRQNVPVEDDHPWHCASTHELHVSRRPAPRPKRNGGGHRISDGQPESGSRHLGGRPGPGRPGGRGFGGGRPGEGRSFEGRGEGRSFEGRGEGRPFEGRGEGRPARSGDDQGARRSFAADGSRPARPGEGRPGEGRPGEGRPEGRGRAGERGNDRSNDRLAGDRPSAGARGPREGARAAAPAGHQGGRPQFDRTGENRGQAGKPAAGNRPHGGRPAGKPGGHAPVKRGRQG